VAVPYIIVAIAAYLIGSIPFGFLVAKAKGIDIRSVGSGNIGATNAMRVLGKPAGISVLLLDALKGYAACTWLVRFDAEVFHSCNRNTLGLYRLLPALRRCLAITTPAG